MMLTPIELVEKYKTRTVEVEFEEDGRVIGRLTMSRLPIEKLVEYYGIFSTVDQDKPASMFTKQNIRKMMSLMTVSIASANEDIPIESVEEFIATNFMKLFEKFTEVNGGGVSIDGEIEESIREEIRNRKNV